MPERLWTEAGPAVRRAVPVRGAVSGRVLPQRRKTPAYPRHVRPG